MTDTLNISSQMGLAVGWRLARIGSGARPMGFVIGDWIFYAEGSNGRGAFDDVISKSQYIAANGIIAQDAGGPLAKLDGAGGVHAETDGDDGVEVVESGEIYYLPSAAVVRNFRTTEFS